MGSIRWLARSPDLAPMQYIFLELLNDQIYWTSVPISMELDQRISTAIRIVHHEILKNRINLESLLRTVIRSSDGQIEY